MKIEDVHSVAIYPAIGVARIGNSPTDYFLGSAIPGKPATDSDDFRDADGNIKRQGVKFHVYGLDKDGKVLGELNSRNDTKIDWRVDLANKKSAWYDFDIAFDIPTAEGVYDSDGFKVPEALQKPVESMLRNDDFIGEIERKKLMIETRMQHITGEGTNLNGSKYQFEGEIGEWKMPVNLGELKTDKLGRLIFLGGKGHSASFTKPAAKLTTFANNDNWHDDTSDGPVDAKVKLSDGRIFDAEGAWVLTAPTNFAVGVQAFSTGYDLITDVMAQMHPELVKEQPSFYEDIYPVLSNLTINQWVNAGISQEFGWGSGYEFDREALLKALNDKSDKMRPLRQNIFNAFRDPTYEQMQPQNWPPLYGDAVTFNMKSTNPRNWFAITELKYNYLQKWATGDFIIDEPQPIKLWDERTPAEQANGLTEAALEETIGGPFHPGCEFTWPMRQKIMYESDKKHLYRIKRRAKAKEYYGDTLDYKTALGEGGPLDGSTPGDITKWMAVPWQTDTSSCLSAYRTYAGEYLPTFWPARVPNDVLTEKDYEKLNSDQGVDDKMNAFDPASRKKWLRGFIYNDKGGFLYGTSIQDRVKGITKFTNEWYKAGIIVKKEVSPTEDFLPKDVWVETGRSIESDPKSTSKGLLAAELSDLEGESGTQEEATLMADVEKAAAKRPDWVDMNPRHLR